jgi:hypothetical protein
MNDPQYVEAARGFAERILRQGGKGDQARIKWALSCATCQVPCAVDVAEVKSFLHAERAAFVADPGAAKQLAKIGVAKADSAVTAEELAAWTMVANLILNLDAVLTRG